jgi:kynurenine formamidase
MAPESARRQPPTVEEVQSYLHRDRNWGRWGPDDQKGALNLVTDEKRVAAGALVRTGRAISLSRDFPVKPGRPNPIPAHHYMKRYPKGVDAGAAADYYGVLYHGTTCTHIDALCHMWDGDGMWNGRDPDRELTFDGSRWGGIDNWADGIFTRGVLLDVPAHRGVDYVTQDEPIHGWELAEVAEHQGVALEPGDALVVYGGRERYDAVNKIPWGATDARPGLHASCLEFIRKSDCCALVWDMMDMLPYGYDLPFTVHGAIFAYGVALVDNVELGPLVQECRRQSRFEFLFTVAPLRVVGGTGAPVNPIALL